MIQTLIAAIGAIAGAILLVVFIVLITTSLEAFMLAIVLFVIPIAHIVHKQVRLHYYRSGGIKR